MLSFFKTRKDLPLIEASSEKIRAIYKKHQWQVFFGLVLGYAMFYVVRAGTRCGEKTYAGCRYRNHRGTRFNGFCVLLYLRICKFSNGFLSDYANIGRFMSISLIASSFVCIFMGMSTASLFFILLWGINGWFQSVGSAPSCLHLPVVLTKTARYGLFHLGWLA